MEELFVYLILLRSGLVSIEEYNEFLDNAFLKYETNEIYLELEFVSGNLDKTVSLLENSINQNQLENKIVGKILLNILEEKYNQTDCNLEELASKTYSVWTKLPHKLGQQEPFHIMSYINEPLSWGDKEQTKELFQKLFDS